MHRSENHKKNISANQTPLNSYWSNFLMFSAFDEVFTWDAFAHASAGTGGGFVAMTAFYPLDHIRTHLQISAKQDKNSITAIRELIEKDGVGSLYSGLGPILTSLAVSNFVYFYTYNSLKAIEKKKGPITTTKNLIVAAVAGIVNVYVTCPLWVVATRLRVQKKGQEKYTGLIQKVYNEEGLAALWSGSTASVVLVSNPTIQFVTYDKLKVFFGKKDYSSLEVFALGAVAKAFATLITYPIQVAQSVLRTKGGKHGKTHEIKEESKEEVKYKNTLDFLIKIFQKEGMAGWFKGLDVKLVQTVLTAAFHFLAYEKIVEFIFHVMRPTEDAKKH
jgi:adenine nucleotide transporter 17